MTPARDERQARRTQNSPLFELASVLVRLDYVASVIEYADHGLIERL
jgi:predicted trehalose synthase